MTNKRKLLSQLDNAISSLNAIRNLIDGEVEESGFPSEAQNKVNDEICLQCGKTLKGKTRTVRGCHESCYKKVKDAIRTGVISEDEAIAAGQIAPHKFSGRPKKTTALDDYLTEKAASMYDKSTEEHAQDLADQLEKASEKLEKTTNKKSVKRKKTKNE